MSEKELLFVTGPRHRLITSGETNPVSSERQASFLSWNNSSKQTHLWTWRPISTSLQAKESILHVQQIDLLLDFTRPDQAPLHLDRLFHAV